MFKKIVKINKIIFALKSWINFFLLIHIFFNYFKIKLLKKEQKKIKFLKIIVSMK